MSYFYLPQSVISLAQTEMGDFDATGTFESEEVIVSTEAMGKLLQFDVEEGMILKKDQIVGLVGYNSVSI